MHLQKLFLSSCLALLVLAGSQRTMLSTTSENNSEDEGMSDGAMAGLVAGSVAGLAVGATAIGVGIKKYQDNKKENNQSEKKGLAVDAELEKLQKNLDQTPDKELSRVSTPPLTPSLNDEGQEIKSISLEEESKRRSEEIRAKNLARGAAPVPGKSGIIPDEDVKRNAVLKAEYEALKAQDPEGKKRALEEEIAQNKQRSEALKQDLQQSETEQKKLVTASEEQRMDENTKRNAVLKAELEALKSQDPEGQKRALEEEMAQNKQRSEALKQSLQQSETEQKKLVAVSEERRIIADQEEAQLKAQEEELKKKSEERLRANQGAEKEAVVLKPQDEEQKKLDGDVKAEQSIKDVDAKQSEAFKAGIMSQSEVVVDKEPVKVDEEKARKEEEKRLKKDSKEKIITYKENLRKAVEQEKSKEAVQVKADQDSEVKAVGQETERLIAEEKVLRAQKDAAIQNRDQVKVRYDEAVKASDAARQEYNQVKNQLKDAPNDEALQKKALDAKAMVDEAEKKSSKVRGDLLGARRTVQIQTALHNDAVSNVKVKTVAAENIAKYQKSVARYIEHNAHIVKLEENIKLLKEDIKKSSGSDMLNKKEVLRLAREDLVKNKQALQKREKNIEKGRAVIEKQIGAEKYKELFPVDVIEDVRKQEHKKAENKVQKQESKVADLRKQIAEHKSSIQDANKTLGTKFRYDSAKGAKGNKVHNQMLSDIEKDKSELQQKKQKLQEAEAKLQKKQNQLKQVKAMPRHY